MAEGVSSVVTGGRLRFVGRVETSNFEPRTLNFECRGELVRASSRRLLPKWFRCRKVFDAQHLLRASGLLALAILLPMTGCMRHEKRADIVIVNGKEPESLDPAIITGQAEMRIAGSMFEGLTRQDPKTGDPIPSLAESWEISPDGRTYTFHLRHNLKWSTGEPLTADDVVYSWIRALDPATASDYAGQLYYLKNGEDFNSRQNQRPGVGRCACAG